MCRRRKVGGRREIKAVSVEALHAQAAFCHHFKPSPPTQDSTRPHLDSLPVQLNSDAPVSGPCKLVLRTTGRAETAGLAHCPVCCDLLVANGTPSDGQVRNHVASDVTKRRPTAAGRCCLVTNSRDHVNSFASVYSV